MKLWWWRWETAVTYFALGLLAGTILTFAGCTGQLETCTPAKEGTWQQ
jgi:hypothetical protein